jgi:hypothetical protein
MGGIGLARRLSATVMYTGGKVSGGMTGCLPLTNNSHLGISPNDDKSYHIRCGYCTFKCVVSIFLNLLQPARFYSRLS